MGNFTINAIKALNEDFYNKVSNDFNRTRQKEWEGWKRIVKLIKKYKQPSILDVGCGNGRFLDFLLQSKIDFKSYCGIDSSEKLLKIARSKYDAQNITLKKQDILEKLDINGKFDVIVMFGLLHHIPSKELRYKLINQLLDLTNNGGFLAVSVWSFMDSSEYGSKIKSNNEVIEYLSNKLRFKISKLDFEENDFVLGWGDPNRAYRYCHYFDNAELAEMLNIFRNYKAVLLDVKAGNDQLNKYIYFYRNHA